MKDTFLGIPFFRFYYPGDVEKVAYELENLQWKRNDFNWIWAGINARGTGKQLHDLPQFADLFLWMNECLEEVRKEIAPNATSFKFVSSWANKNDPGDHFFDHTHPNCFLSSNYYASGLPQDKTVWLLPNPWYSNTNISPFGDYTDTKYHIMHEEPTEAGKFICFPPTIRHYAQPNTTNGPRMTIAANAFPSGLIESGGVSRMYVEVTK
jgi:hypothetical protein